MKVPHARGKQKSRAPANDVPWWKAPLFSRNSFSPRLLMAWQAFYFMCWVIYRWVLNEPRVVNGILVQPGGIEGIVGILAGLVSVLLGLGTLQKIQLDGGQAMPPDEQQPPEGEEKKEPCEPQSTATE